MPQLEERDAVVIGSGQAGSPLSMALAQAGRSTALIERAHIGGTCVNEGCTPTKTMIASARVAYMARRAADYGVQTGPVKVDMHAVRERKRDIVNSFRSGSQKRIESTDSLELIMGEAHFTGLRTIEVKLRSGETREISASTVVINTGARPRIPQLPGIGEISALNSTSIMELEEVPEHLLVIGGGYVGLEFGQMFNRFGSLVTIVQRDDQLLPLEDADVAEEIAEILRQDGVKVILDSTATSVKRTDKDHIKLTVHGPHGDQAFEGSHLLVAAGRVPNTDQLNLEATGIQIDKRGFIPVDEFLQTAVPGVYAVGDVNGGPPFTHISYDDYRILRHNLLERGNSSTAGRLVPYNVFTDPQLGRVGLSEKQAKAQGINYRVAKIPMEWVARALETDERRGMIKAIVDKQDGRILGAAVLSPEGGELMAALQMAIMGEIPYTVLQDGIFAHPTLAESLNTLFANIT